MVRRSPSVWVGTRQAGVTLSIGRFSLALTRYSHYHHRIRSSSIIITFVWNEAFIGRSGPNLEVSVNPIARNSRVESLTLRRTGHLIQKGQHLLYVLCACAALKDIATWIATWKGLGLGLGLTLLCGLRRGRQEQGLRRSAMLGLAFTLAVARYCFTSTEAYVQNRNRLFLSPSSPVFPTLLHSYCMTIAQYTTSPRPPVCMLYAIHYW